MGLENGILISNMSYVTSYVTIEFALPATTKYAKKVLIGSDTALKVHRPNLRAQRHARTLSANIERCVGRALNVENHIAANTLGEELVHM